MGKEKQCPGGGTVGLQHGGCWGRAGGAAVSHRDFCGVNSIVSANNGTSIWYLSELPVVTVSFWEAAVLCVRVDSSVPCFPALLSHVIRGTHFVC